MQEDVSAETINSEAQEKDDRKCEFDKSLEGICLKNNFFHLNINSVAT